MIKYLEKTQIDCEPTSIVEPVATDNYNETKILEKVKTKNVNQCFAVALQFSIAGMGNRNYGKAVIDGVIFDVLQIMKENDIHFNNAQNSVLEEDTLTPKRLARLFRFQISEWILNNRPSFLSTKYLLECNNPEKVFPCAEYFIDESESGELIQAYSNLDALMDTNFVSKVNSVIRARKTSERLAKLKMSH